MAATNIIQHFCSSFSGALGTSIPNRSDMSNGILRALGYRLWCSYKRRWILMTIFIAIPIVLSGLFLLLKAENILTKTSREEHPVNHKPFALKDLLHSCSSMSPIAVCPDNADTRKLMQEVSSMFTEAKSSLGKASCNCVI